MLGSEVGIGYAEEEREFSDKKGEKRKYQQRTIRFFESLDIVDNTVPIIQREEPVPTDEERAGKIPF